MYHGHSLGQHLTGWVGKHNRFSFSLFYRGPRIYIERTPFLSNNRVICFRPEEGGFSFPLFLEATNIVASFGLVGRSPKNFETGLSLHRGKEAPTYHHVIISTYTGDDDDDVRDDQCLLLL